MTAGPSVPEIVHLLAARILPLVMDLLPGGHREGHEWVVGSIRGEAGRSLSVNLHGKAGIWADFSSDHDLRGDALDLVCATLGLTKAEAIIWSKKWLGIEAGDYSLPPAPPAKAEKLVEQDDQVNRWLRPWSRAVPIAGTLAEIYLRARGLAFDDPAGRVLRFDAKHHRRNPADELEIVPAMLALLSDVYTGEPCGIGRCCLLSDGSDRIRNGGKLSRGRARDAVVLLSGFCEPLGGLCVCEGVETGVALLGAGLGPVWACGGMLGSFPVLGGIECLTIAADNDKAGQDKAEATAARWEAAGREVVVIMPPSGDWADKGDAA